MIGAKGTIYTKGIDTAVKAYTRIAQDLSGEPVARSMKTATLYITADAKRLSVVDTGRLRSSISPAVEVAGKRVLGIVGSNVKYAPFVEMGTKPHYPPLAALEKWANRHGISAYLVQRAIGKRGTKARPFLKPAFEANVQRIINLIGQTVSRIVSARYK